MDIIRMEREDIEGQGWRLKSELAEWDLGGESENFL